MCSIYLVLLMFSILQHATSLKCYNCADSDDTYSSCRYMDVTSSYSNITEVECPIGICLKLKPPAINGRNSIARGCYDKNLCTELSVCYTCHDKDLCNSSSKMTPFTTMLVGLIIVASCRLVFCYVR